ncbi:Uu.00g083990.m01.CDS01 [Anthostomella pinea]|uniref:Uu.00g083990.m01.CDS01 n=1 Tax=Anthostomella pinea TaxID=933095 RepID=A0AAI8VLR6_9PEZI|nr:Uu.00g083990.m01.CDS01 [Anthostomella pinea]
MEQTLSLLTKAQGPTPFTKFNDLPPELRIKIWQYAMPDARTVVVSSPYSTQSQQQTPKSIDEALLQAPSNKKGEETWQSSTQIPTLLHVNAEARHEALKHYKLSLGVGSTQPRIYVDFTRDAIFFGNAELKPECSSLWASTQDLYQVERLALVPEGAWRVLRWKKVDLNSLQKMIFVHGTEKVKKLGPLPELVEDAPLEVETKLEEQILHMDVAQATFSQSCILDPMKKRMQAAREELETLMMVLPTQWEKEPAVSTAVFR